MVVGGKGRECVRHMVHHRVASVAHQYHVLEWTAPALEGPQLHQGPALYFWDKGDYFLEEGVVVFEGVAELLKIGVFDVPDFVFAVMFEDQVEVPAA